MEHQSIDHRDRPFVRWHENGRDQRAHWVWASRHEFPENIVVAGDELRADQALRLARQGRAVLWRGDYHNARQLLAAMRRRLERRPVRSDGTPAEHFRRHRAATAYRAGVLNRILIPFGPGYRVDVRNAPNVSAACTRAFGPAPEPLVMSLPELLGALGADQWRIRGVAVPVLGETIHPHFGVFAPTRQEYVELAAAAPWPRPKTAFDTGTGTGVLAALLVRRGARHVVATDIAPRAVACARDNVARLGLAQQIRVEENDLFPNGRADLVVCNPPWLPSIPTSTLDAAIYDPDSAMLRGFLHALPHHLSRDGEAWLILSDLAELLGLREPGELTGMFAAAGLTVLGRHDTRPSRRTSRRTDPLARYRTDEVTSLWRLTCQ